MLGTVLRFTGYVCEGHGHVMSNQVGWKPMRCEVSGVFCRWTAGPRRLSEWWVYALSASKVIFRARTHSWYLFSTVVMMMGGGKGRHKRRRKNGPSLKQSITNQSKRGTNDAHCCCYLMESKTAAGANLAIKA